MKLEPNFDRKDLFTQSCWSKILFPDTEQIQIEFEYKRSHLFACFLFRKSWKYRFLECPKFTPHNVFIDHQVDFPDSYKSYLKEIELLKMLKTILTSFDLITCKFHGSIQHASVDKSQNEFYQTAPSAYIRGQNDIDQLWQKMYRNTRNHIVHAIQSNIEFKEISPLEFSNLIRSSNYYTTSGLTAEMVQNLYGAFHPNGILKITAAVFEEKIMSSAMTIHWKSDCYLLVNVLSDDQKIRSANTALLWHLIEKSIQQSVHFHFDGSSVGDIMQKYKSFGAETCGYIYGKIIHSKILRHIYIHKM
ncbi:MAG: hypothetical protein IPM48_04150 [Saprospiraceae bacterium]|nr:hypothetical protein [Saprospiraceae bacterium]